MARTTMIARSQRARVIAAAPALVAIFLFGQGVLDRLGWRVDLTPERRYTLSGRADHVLAGVRSDVRILGDRKSVV